MIPDRYRPVYRLRRFAWVRRRLGGRWECWARDVPVEHWASPVTVRTEAYWLHNKECPLRRNRPLIAQHKPGWRLMAEENHNEPTFPALAHVPDLAP